MQECDCFPCGEKCLEEFEIPMYGECGGQCQSVEIPCHSKCLKSTRQCGDFCLNDDMKDDFYECSTDGVVQCQSLTSPCDGVCPGGLVLCDGGQVCVSPSSPLYKNCSGSCVPLEAPCDGQCRDGSKLCGAECVDILNSTVMSCGGQCQPASLPCEGECSLGHGLCGDSCLPHTGDVWTCDGECVSAGLPCHSSCPTGRVLQDGACVSPADLCPEELQCLQDSDCQDGAACLLQGEKFYCQCRLGYTLQEPPDNEYHFNEGLASCPKTGKCIEQSNLAQNCNCYSGDNVTICLFCNATTSYSALIYQYTESLPGNSQGTMFSLIYQDHPRPDADIQNRGAHLQSDRVPGLLV